MHADYHFPCLEEVSQEIKKMNGENQIQKR